MNRIIFFCFLLVNPLFGKGQIIITIAGTGANSNNGDGGQASVANINNPTWGVIDKFGNYYICSGLGHKIRKIDINGIITTVAGTGVGGYNGDGGMADTSQIKLPGSVAVDSMGNVFIADISNHRVRKVDIASGIITTIAGTGISGFNGDNIMASSAQLYSPNDICFDKLGNLYISDAGNYRVRKISPSGIITTAIGDGIAGNSGDGGLATNARINSSRSIAVDANNNLYVVNQGVGALNVRKVLVTTGIINTVAGSGSSTYNGDNIPATSANMGPVRIAFDNYGFMYITDNWNDRIRKVDASGNISTVAGIGTMGYSGDGGLATLAEINSPSGIAFDSCNNLYITEIQVGRIRKVAFNPTCLPVNVQEHTPISFNLYPNPANTNLTITGTHLQNISITNTLGQIVHWQKASAEKTVVDISSLNAGIYFVTVTDAQGAKVTKKVVKE
jgi:sugar lactone lactonase YvrE